MHTSFLLKALIITLSAVFSASFDPDSSNTGGNGSPRRNASSDHIYEQSAYYEPAHKKARTDAESSSNSGGSNIGNQSSRAVYDKIVAIYEALMNYIKITLQNAIENVAGDTSSVKL